MTYVVDQLEKKGLVVRLKDEKDRRINYVMLSPKGLNDTEIIYNKHYEEMRKRFDKLTSEEEVTLQNLLKKIGKEG
ncbi:MarR family transcriptional regulator [Erysipelothrix sp. Poltava]|nr:MarR family transcriptional regulator [Erysipelothrix sp. Poltava]